MSHSKRRTTKDGNASRTPALQTEGAGGDSALNPEYSLQYSDAQLLPGPLQGDLLPQQQYSYPALQEQGVGDLSAPHQMYSQTPFAGQAASGGPPASHDLYQPTPYSGEMSANVPAPSQLYSAQEPSVPQQLFPHMPYEDPTSGGPVYDQLVPPQGDPVPPVPVPGLAYFSPEDESAAPSHQYPYNVAAAEDSYTYRDADSSGLQILPQMGAMLPDAYSGAQALGVPSLTQAGPAQHSMEAAEQDFQDPGLDITEWDSDVLKRALEMLPYSDASTSYASVSGTSALQPPLQEPALATPLAAPLPAAAPAPVGRGSTLPRPRQSRDRVRKPKLYEQEGPLDDPEEEKRRVRARKQKEIRDREREKERLQQATLQSLIKKVEDLKVEKSHRQRTVQDLEAQLRGRTNLAPGSHHPDSEAQRAPPENPEDEEMQQEEHDQVDAQQGHLGEAGSPPHQHQEEKTPPQQQQQQHTEEKEEVPSATEESAKKQSQEKQSQDEVDNNESKTPEDCGDNEATK